MNRKEILQAAIHATCGERDVQYEKPEDNFERIAELWNAHMIIRPGVPPSHRFTGEDVAWMLMQVKQARAINNYNEDNYVDGAGYIACGGEIARRFAQEKS